VRGFGVEVVVIEPGLIKTEFGRAAASSIDSDADPEGPYARFNAALSNTMTEAYEGPMARLAAGPDAVARAIEKAITARRPRTRYKVAASARVMLGLRALLPDRAWDSAVGSSFKRPGA
jgi:short-subunit dehydrogenase